MHEVNPAVYVHRPQPERELNNHLDGSLHVMLCGESGIGKSWMYKTVCSKKGIRYLIAESANVSRFGSFENEFRNLLQRISPIQQVGYKESKKASLKVPVAEGGLENVREYKYREGDAFHSLLEAMYRENYKLLVFENFERIIDTPDLLKQLGDLLTLLDNPDYAKFGVRFLLVGAIPDAAHYFKSTANQVTIANRIKEIPIYYGLTHSQTETLCDAGFNNLLRVDLNSTVFDSLVDQVHHLTLGIPQRIHELCLEIGYSMESRGFDISDGEIKQVLSEASVKWVRGSLIQLHTSLESRINLGNPDARRNQVLYVLSDIKKDSFRAKDVEDLLRRLFPELKDKALNAGQILKDLSVGESPILRTNSKKGYYQFTNGAYRMVIRAILRIESGHISVKHVTYGSY